MDGFYHIVMNLQHYLFKVFIYPSDGYPADMAKDLDVVPGPRFMIKMRPAPPEIYLRSLALSHHTGKNTLFEN